MISKRETKYGRYKNRNWYIYTYILYVREGVGRFSAYRMSPYICASERRKNRKRPHKSQTFLSEGLNGTARLLSESCTKVKMPASVCNKIYIREKINLHPYVSLRASVCSEIYIREKIFAHPYVCKNRKNKPQY